jgi:hypothetical protein
MFKKIYTLFAIGMLLSACSEDTMDSINKDKNHPNDVASKYTLTDVMTSSAFSVTSSDLAFYASSYIEHNVGIYNQLYNAETRNGEPFDASTYNNSWNSIYSNLYALKGVIQKCSDGGSEAGNTQNLGIAQILTSYNLAVLTDCFGDIPWTEALQPGVIYQPKIDKQEAIYTQIFTFLDAGIANLAKTSTISIGGQDLVYGVDPSSKDVRDQADINVLWTKAAKGLKARYLMHLSFRNAKYQEVIDNINASFANANEEFKFAQYDGSAAKNPFYSFFTDRNYFGASQSLHDKLVDRNDPRDAKFFIQYPGSAKLLFAQNGTTDQAQKKYGISALNNATAPTYMLSYHELLFLKAEAYARLGISHLPEAETALKAAISAAFVKLNVGLTAADAANYYTNSVKAKFDANPLSEIAVQKYIAFYQDEALEAYNDYRRLAALGTVIPLSNPLPVPLRYTYGNSDVTTNPNIREAYGDGSYVKTEKVWWAGGTR